ncbi:MAG: oxidoreductase [Peptococcaceae bacterium]|nr:oxidoreductase [Peptococcaceae bacterium]
MRKLRLASYWASACGGCDVAILDTNEHILDIAAVADIVFWPVAVDFKYSDVEAYDDRSIDVCLFHGAVRNSENEHLARLLRQKSEVLVAFGSCAVSGGIPALANFKRREDILNRVYRESPSTENPESVLPQPHFTAGDITLDLPDFYRRVYALDDIVPVDYYLPGCPPTPERIWEVFEVIVSGQLPPAGSTVGVADHSLCHECSRVKKEKKVKTFYRPHEIIPDRENCLLEQGLICLGPVTRGGCGARCIAANMACRGCYGPMPGIIDQGAKFISTLGSIIDEDRVEDAGAVIDRIVDPAGTFFRFSMAKSLLKGARQP